MNAFYFSSLEPEPKMFESNRLLYSHQQKQETRTKVREHLLFLENPQVLSFSAKLNRKAPSFLLYLNLKGVKITFHYKLIAGSKRMFALSTLLLLGVHTLLNDRELRLCTEIFFYNKNNSSGI